MTDMRLTISCWWSVIESVCFTLFAVLHALLENVVVFPELLNLLFSLNEVHV